jgi:protein required for attachment to host cells
MTVSRVVLARRRVGPAIEDLTHGTPADLVRGRRRRLGAHRSSAPGRDHESATVSRHAVEPRVDLHKAEKHDFMGEVAAALNAAGAERAFDRLILVAPAHALSDLEKALDAPTRAKVTARLQKDLTHTPNGDLPSHLAGLIPL